MPKRCKQRLYGVAIELHQKMEDHLVAPAGCHESLPRSGLVQCRAFLAQRRGHGRAVACRLLIRAGGLKTYWTKPPGTALPLLWGLQGGEELRGPEKAAANEE
jgi:hypothetical protein